MTAELIALAFLGAAVLFVLLAGGYALFGHPHSPESRERHRHVVSGFAIAGGILFGAVIVACLIFGLGIAFFGLESSRISKPVAFVLAAASFGLIALFVQRWAKYFVGWMLWGVFNALTEARTGHVLNLPLVPVPLSVALTLAGLSAITVIVSVRFRGDGYKLGLVDKGALLLWVLAFAIGANTERYMLISLSVGCAGLVFAAANHYCRRRFSRTKHELVVPDCR